MSVAAKCLYEAGFVPGGNTVIYTAPAKTTTIVDKFTFTNTSGLATAASINIIPSGGAAGSSNLITDAVSISAGATYSATEMQNQILNAGDSINVIASAGGVVVARVSGREIS